MNIKELMQVIGLDVLSEAPVEGISDDSRVVKENWLFIARKGVNTTGYDYISEARRKKAAVLSDTKHDDPDVLYHENLKQAIPMLLHAFYGDMNDHLCIIGVTGTNGKSSVTDIICQMLQMAGCQVMTIGTQWITFPNHRISISNTTPSIFVLAYYFHYALQHNITHIIMEVSSHAIDQERISFIRYDAVIYTNITRDHMDYHLTPAHYQYTKFKLRKYLKKDGIIILNNDDPVLQSIYQLTNHKCITVGCTEAHMPLRYIHESDHGSSFQLHQHYFHTRLLSRVNIYNILEAITLCRWLGISYGKCQKYTELLKPVAGRLQSLRTNRSFSIWIDYAHTYMAVKNLVDFANQVAHGKVILVIGCGGNREKEKRREIGKYCAENCNCTIVTSDNPRNEPLLNIILDILPKEHPRMKIIENRACAIKHAVNIAQKSDIIIIAGKGNENTQTIGDQEYPFHDETCVCELLERKGISWY